MKMFEGMLARRYIKEQKRHSILTICSIAIALAMMTLLFCGFSTVVDCVRDAACLSEGEYHIAISNITYEQGEAISAFVEDKGSCTIISNDTDFTALLLFDDYIGYTQNYMKEIAQKARLNMIIGDTYCFFSDDDIVSYYNENTTLMLLDMIDLQSRFQFAQVFALFYIFVLFFVIALRLVIDTAFEVSSKERERQFGVLQSIGATPKQTARIITVEGLMLSVVGIPIGVVLGLGLSYIAYRAVLSSGIAEAFLTAQQAENIIHFHVSPMLILIGVITGLAWVMLSAYGTGMRIVRMSPVQAISSRVNTVKKVKKHSLFGLIFGWTGKLASRNNMRQKKRYIITVLSLTISISLFAASSIIIHQIREAKEQDYRNRYGALRDEDFRITFENGYNYTEIRDYYFDPIYYCEGIDSMMQSGYFDNFYYDHEKWGSYSLTGDYENDTDQISVFIRYYNKNSYDALFDGEPPISYEELSHQDGYIMIDDDYHNNAWKKISEEGAAAVQVQKHYRYTEEEYNALPPELQEIVGLTEIEGVPQEDMVPLYSLIEDEVEEYKIICTSHTSKDNEYWFDAVDLVGTMDQYESGDYNRYGNVGAYVWLSCDLADGADHDKAVEFIENIGDNIYLSNDFYIERQKLDATLSAITIGVTFLIIMIALVATVNMVNILSTGILNRRGEIAAMQSVGMTERQLYKMTIIECLQYSLGSGVMSVMLCELMMLATQELLTQMGLIWDYSHAISYTAPLPRIGIAVIISFIIALIASLIPLRTMQKASLVDQIRNIE